MVGRKCSCFHQMKVYKNQRFFSHFLRSRGTISDFEARSFNWKEGALPASVRIASSL